MRNKGLIKEGDMALNYKKERFYHAAGTIREAQEQHFIYAFVLRRLFLLCVNFIRNMKFLPQI